MLLCQRKMMTCKSINFKIYFFVRQFDLNLILFFNLNVFFLYFIALNFLYLISFEKLYLFQSIYFKYKYYIFFFLQQVIINEIKFPFFFSFKTIFYFYFISSKFESNKIRNSFFIFYKIYYPDISCLDTIINMIKKSITSKFLIKILFFDLLDWIIFILKYNISNKIV